MDFKLLLTAVWTVAGTALYVLMPGFAPFFLPLALVAPLLWSQRDAAFGRRLLEISALSGLLALASAYLLINASWSLEPARAYIAVSIFIMLSLVLHILIRTLPELQAEPLRAMALGFYVGYAICALVLSIEIAFQHPIHMHLFRVLRTLSPRMSELVVQDSVVQELPSFLLNRHVAALAFLVWPALLIAAQLAASQRVRTVLLACLLPVIPAVYMSDHETSKLAILGGAAAFLVARLVPRATNALVVMAWLIACTAPLPLASLAYDLQLYHADWLQPSARHRIVIWGVTSQRAGEAALLGHGMVTARAIGKQEGEHPVYAPGTNFRLSVGPHAHNAYIEAWFDTGAVGAVLLLMIGIVTLRAISRLAASVQPIFYGMYATVTLLAASDTSLWSRSFLASFGISAIFGVLAWSFGRSARETCAAKGAAA